MDVLLLSRLQFAITAAIHFIFPALTIGMAWLNVVFVARYVRSGDLEDQKLANFWINVFTLTFALGVATGVVMVFQFGTNWGDYARFVGDIFGAPLAAEAVLAFFLEATFLGVLVWGRNRIGKKLFLVSSFLVAFGATLSAFWIIAANSWQQTPAGFTLVNGRPELSNFIAAVFSPSTIPRYLHTVDSCLIAGSLFVMGVSAWFLLRRKNEAFALKSIKTALVFFLIASLVQVALGHLHAVQVANTQPAKLAAFEGIFETEEGAPMLIFGIPNEEEGKMSVAIGIPKLLSFIATGDPNATIQGLNDFPEDARPPVALSFYPFHLMFYLGGYFILLGLIGIFYRAKNKLPESRFFLKLALYSIPLGVIACELGWMAAEMGRQPWVVYGLLRTADAVSYNVPAFQVLLSIFIFIILFFLLCLVYLFLLRRKLEAGPDGLDSYSFDNDDADVGNTVVGGE
ncbi:MAG: cytochrome ubiquinol oxidase subunit I [Syntrophomonadaceae bacterium]|jgi:cytochrome d ubiquinol oxidase subunit I|nr:cytochrome ubiquinol oxidase subunit I [Syntrophomonadaceae bacterium]